MLCKHSRTTVAFIDHHCEDDVTTLCIDVWHEKKEENTILL